MPEGSKTEKATPKRRRDERKKGNVFKSQDVIIVVSLLGGFIALQLLFPLMYDVVKSCITEYFGHVAEISTLSNEETLRFQSDMMLKVVYGAFPILMVSVALTIIATGVQTRFLIATESLKPKFSRMNPIEGFKKMFSARNVVELFKNLFKISLLIIVLVRFMADRVKELTLIMSMEINNAVAYILTECVALVMQITMWFVVIAFFDFLYQWWEYERQIKMTKEEIKEEYKQMEGNPEIKGKIKQMQRQRAMSRMMQAVPTADVIVRNPTHFAVALKYDKEKNSAPMVVAKGQDELALRIVKVGEENQVPLIEDQPLARALYASTDLNREIPAEFYGAVAEILVYVYKLNQKEV